MSEEEPKPIDFTKMFDLDRTRLTREMVDRMEQAMREIDAARDDLKAVIAECREAEFRKRDIEAMKKIAKFRKDDKQSAAREQIEALLRIGRAVQFDLFDEGD